MNASCGEYCYICNTENCLSSEHYNIERAFIVQILNGERDPDTALHFLKEFHKKTFLMKESNEQR